MIILPTPAEPVTHAPSETRIRALLIAYRGDLGPLTDIRLIPEKRWAELVEQYGEAGR